jgi:hypothetical protein
MMYGNCIRSPSAIWCGLKPVNGITQEKFLHDLSSFYEKHLPGKQTSEKGTPLLEDGTPLPDPGDDFDPNEKFDPDKYEIIPYLTKGLMYDALPALATGGDHLVDILGVLDTESMANQTSIIKALGHGSKTISLPTKIFTQNEWRLWSRNFEGWAV